MPRLVSGRDLSPNVRREVLAAFVYRWTSDNPHRAAAYGTCPQCGVPGGSPAAWEEPRRVGCAQRHPVIPLETDEQWLAGHAFYVTRDGRLAARRGAVPLAAAETTTATWTAPRTGPGAALRAVVARRVAAGAPTYTEIPPSGGGRATPDAP